MKTLILATAEYNFAQTDRMIALVRDRGRHFDILFISYGGGFEDRIKRGPTIR